MTDAEEFNRRNVEEFPANNGRLGASFERAPVLLLHSTGARSGEARVSPMRYLADGDRYRPDDDLAKTLGDNVRTMMALRLPAETRSASGPPHRTKLIDSRWLPGCRMKS